MKARFYITNETFQEKFLILKSMNQTVLGLPFFQNNVIAMHPRTQTLKLPHITIQLNAKSTEMAKSALCKPKSIGFSGHINHQP